MEDTVEICLQRRDPGELANVKFKGSSLRYVLLTLNFILSVSVLGSSGPGPQW